MGKKIDLTGRKFTRLKVIEEAGRDANGQVLWKCECDCKNSAPIIVRGRDLRSGGTKSCGCLNKERATENIKKQTVDHSNPNFIRSTKLSPFNTSGVRGVTFTKKSGKWRAYIGHKGKQIYLGEYDKKEDAVKIRLLAEEKYYSDIRNEGK